MPEDEKTPYQSIRRAIHHNVWGNLGSPLQAWVEEFKYILEQRRWLTLEIEEALANIYESIQPLKTLDKAITDESSAFSPVVLHDLTVRAIRAIESYRTSFAQASKTLRERLAWQDADAEFNEYMGSLDKFLNSKVPDISLTVLQETLKRL